MGMSLKITLVAALLLCSVPARALITKDATAGDKQIDSGSTVAFPAITPTASGEMLTVLISCNSGANPCLSSISDTGVNSWSKAGSTCTNTGEAAEVWYELNASTSSTTVTVTKSASQTIRAVLSAWAGVATSGALDVTATCASGVSSTAAIGPITPSQANELVIGTCNQNQVGTGVTVAAPFTAMATDTNKVNMAAYVIQTSAIAATMTWTIASNFYACSMSSFEQAAAAAAGPTCADIPMAKRKGLNVSACGPRL